MKNVPLKKNIGVIALTFALLIGAVVFTIATASSYETSSTPDLFSAPCEKCAELVEIGLEMELALCKEKRWIRSAWVKGYVGEPPDKKFFCCQNKDGWRFRADPPNCNRRDLKSCVAIRNDRHAEHAKCVAEPPENQIWE